MCRGDAVDMFLSTEKLLPFNICFSEQILDIRCVIMRENHLRVISSRAIGLVISRLPSQSCGLDIRIISAFFQSVGISCCIKHLLKRLRSDANIFGPLCWIRMFFIPLGPGAFWPLI